MDIPGDPLDRWGMVSIRIAEGVMNKAEDTKPPAGDLIAIRGNSNGDCGSLFPMYTRVDIQDWDRQLRRMERKGWAEWLLNESWGWQWYITLTFKDIIHPEQADRCYRKFVRINNERIYGKRYIRYHKGITWARGLEYQRRGVIHFHALFSGLPSYWENGEHRKRAMKDWERTADKCGFARIYPYKKGACAYISKYISKGGELDIWVGDQERRDQLSMFAV
ncbi:hypothetical protein ES703_89067 [subsurface metagenome]